MRSSIFDLKTFAVYITASDGSVFQVVAVRFGKEFFLMGLYPYEEHVLKLNFHTDYAYSMCDVTNVGYKI